MTLSRIVGAVLGAAGFGILGAIAWMIYGSPEGDPLIVLGIPGAMLGSLLGLTLIFVGAALAWRGGRRRPS